MNKIGLFDPSLSGNAGEPSLNLGDLIIFEAVTKQLHEIFPGVELVRVSSHTLPGPKELNAIKACDYMMIGGTNILSSDINTYNQWKIMKEKYNRFFSTVPVKNVLLMGVGWWQYQDKPTTATQSFYKKVLNKNLQHSIRDGYTQKMLASANINNVINTLCPTMWELNGQATNRKGSAADCLFTITDYMQDPVNDNALIKIILEHYTGKVFCFPQGTRDVKYLNTLEVYRENKNRIEVLNRTMPDFVTCLSSGQVDYIGTRLHAGIKTLQLHKNSLIIIVDNRAKEMAKDCNLPVAERSDHEMIRRWIRGEKLYENIKLPLEDINTWKNQFRR